MGVNRGLKSVGGMGPKRGLRRENGRKGAERMPSKRVYPRLKQQGVTKEKGAFFLKGGSAEGKQAWLESKESF